MDHPFSSFAMATNDKVYEDVSKIKKNVQGGKAFGAALSAFEKELDQIGAEYLAGNSEATQADIDKYKAKFLIYDEDRSGDISLDELKRMMEKLGKAVTHKEAIQMISQVDTVGKGTIFYKYVTSALLSFLTVHIRTDSHYIENCAFATQTNRRPSPSLFSVTRDFLQMMLGPSSNSILKKILMFEELSKPKEDPMKKGPAPKKSLADLP